MRDPAEYAKGHLAGSINIGLGGQYATWAGTVLDRGKPIVIIAEPGREQEAALRLGRIGFDHIKGYLKSGMAALAERPDLVWPTERISAPMVAEELTARIRRSCWISGTPGVGDEAHRRQRECAAQSPAGAHRGDSARPTHCGALRGRLPLFIAASILHQYGITHLIEMAGGLSAWEAAKLPVISEASTTSA